MTENENENEHIIIGTSDDDLNDHYDMATDDNTKSDELLRRMFDSNDDDIIDNALFILPTTLKVKEHDAGTGVTFKKVQPGRPFLRR